MRQKFPACTLAVSVDEKEEKLQAMSTMTDLVHNSSAFVYGLTHRQPTKRERIAGWAKRSGKILAPIAVAAGAMQMARSRMKHGNTTS
jgi:hypothetical protein